MRKEREALRLSLAHGFSNRKASESVGMSHNSIKRYLRIARENNLGWPEIAELDDQALEKLLRPKRHQGVQIKQHPIWTLVDARHASGDTLLEIWSDFRTQFPEGIAPSTFNQNYRNWKRSHGLVMRQTHPPGERLFVDFSGDGPRYIDQATGEIVKLELFVAVLGCSNYTYARAVMTQNLPDWLECHVRMFEFFGAVPKLVVPDNLRSAVSKACRYDPIINPLYAELIRHYETAIFPARARRPQDKGKVEVGVRFAQRVIVRQLRKRTFHSLVEVNKAVAEMLDVLNNKEFSKIPGTRRSRFDEQDRPAMLPLAAEPFPIPEWHGSLQVPLDYHVTVDLHSYSVPYRLAREKVDVRLGAELVRFYHGSKEVACHRRSYVKGGTTTQPDHMPKNHRAYSEQTPENMLAWGSRVGPNAGAFVKELIDRSKHFHIATRAIAGLQSLAAKYTSERLEAACARALGIRSYTYSSVQSILKGELDKRPLHRDETPIPRPIRNVRGSAYYQTKTGEPA
ncbi:MAG: IS21 family transposase [Rhodocyclaceae bacterium]|nr:IS21 family transposase [Rhodocyclaceae bacterium]